MEHSGDEFDLFELEVPFVFLASRGPEGPVKLHFPPSTTWAAAIRHLAVALGIELTSARWFLGAGLSRHPLPELDSPIGLCASPYSRHTIQISWMEDVQALGPLQLLPRLPREHRLLLALPSEACELAIWSLDTMSLYKLRRVCWALLCLVGPPYAGSHTRAWLQDDGHRRVFMHPDPLRGGARSAS